MRYSHFESLRPICPVCKYSSNFQDFELRIATIAKETKSQIVEGVLHCTNPLCQCEFPILDGIPILLPNIRSYISDQIHHLISRSDLSETMESILGDCCSQGSVFDSMRQHLSSYVWGHYADLDPIESNDGQVDNSIVTLLEAGLRLESKAATHARSSRSGPNLDIGCGPGRTTFAIADRTGRLTLGIDLNFSMLRVASNVLRSGQICYPRRRHGLVYDRREIPVHFSNMELVDFWICDGLALPFPDEEFAMVTGLNVLDSVSSPGSLLHSVARTLEREGAAILGCPFDWSTAVTPIENWIGGHSQRGADSGDSVAWLRRWLSDDKRPMPRLELVAEHDELPWTMRMHNRSSITYLVHMLVARCVR